MSQKLDVTPVPLRLPLRLHPIVSTLTSGLLATQSLSSTALHPTRPISAFALFFIWALGPGGFVTTLLPGPTPLPASHFLSDPYPLPPSAPILPP